MSDQSSDTQTTVKDFWDASRELDNTYSVFPKSCGLSEVEYYSLFFIYEGDITQSQICEKMYFSRSTLNSAFRQLRKKDLIYLESCDDNQRSKKAFLTESGKAFVEKYVLKENKIEERAWLNMSEEERKTLVTLTKKINRLIQEEIKTIKS